MRPDLMKTAHPNFLPGLSEIFSDDVGKRKGSPRAERYQARMDICGAVLRMVRLPCAQAGWTVEERVLRPLRTGNYIFYFLFLCMPRACECL